MFLAGNRCGKTLAGTAETSMHATGLYPKDWKGLVLTKPRNMWVAGESLGAVRGAIMELYMGGNDEENFGKGFLPKDSLISWGWNRHAAKVLDYVKVRHISGGVVTIWFKSYEQGRKIFQSDKVDFIHLDEEPDEGIFGECSARLMGTGGGMIITMTPLSGMSEVCLRFLEADGDNTKYYSYTSATIWDNPYISDEEKEVTVAGYEAHQLEARTKGIPAMGSGLIYAIPESVFVVKPFELPEHYEFGYGMDFGWNNTAVVMGATDPVTNITYIYNVYKRGEMNYSEHASALKDLGCGKLAGVCDPAGQAKGQDDGKRLIEQYREEGLNITKADNSVASGISKVYNKLRHGTLKVFDTPETDPLIREMRKYHRDEKGEVVKRDDHACDSLRYFIVSGLKKARPLNFKASIKNKFTKAVNWRTV